MQNKEPPPFGVSMQDEDLETVLVKNIVHTFQGVKAEIAISALVRVLETLLVGVAPSKGGAMKFVGTVGKHLRKGVNNKKPEEFGFLKSGPDDNDPIIYDKLKGPH